MSNTTPETPKDNERQLNVPDVGLPRVVIVGGGFGGIKLARGLQNSRHQVVLLDRNNYHTFQPLLYQVATAGLEPDSIAGPLRKLMERQKNFYFRMAKVQRIDAEAKEVHTSIGSLTYDVLVIATGSRTNYFGLEERFGKAFPLKQVPQALDLRSHLLQNFEKAVVTPDDSEKQSLMNFAIVGGGPTGVEVAGALGELKMHVLPRDYPDLNLSRMNIYLVEGLPRLLNGMSDRSAEQALKYLKRFDVNVLLERRVNTFDGRTIELSDGTRIPCQTVVWAAGVRGNMMDGFPEAVQHKGRIKVDEYNRVPGLQDVYALGDVAAMITEESPQGFPMLAPVAIQQGQLLAKNLRLMQRGKEPKPFKYRDKGSMATIGRNRAVVDLPGLHFGGLFAWFTWMFIHLLSIIGFRNKLVVFSNWVWNYFTYDRGTRLIIRPYEPRDHTKDGG